MSGLTDDQRHVLVAMYRHERDPGPEGGLTSERDARTFAPVGVGNGPGEVPAIMRELDALGLVEWVYAGPTQVWAVTEAGERAVEEPS